MKINPKLLEILACPQCKQPVELDESGDWINCSTCRVRFPIRDDIPVMLLDEVQPYED